MTKGLLESDGSLIIESAIGSCLVQNNIKYIYEDLSLRYLTKFSFFDKNYPNFIYTPGDLTISSDYTDAIAISNIKFVCCGTLTIKCRNLSMHNVEIIAQNYSANCESVFLKMSISNANEIIQIVNMFELFDVVQPLLGDQEFTYDTLPDSQI